MKSRRITGSAENGFVIVFDPGDEVVGTLAKFAAQEKISGAFFYGLGAFERVTLAFFDLQKNEYEHIPINEQVEVISLVGNIAIYKGEAKVHAHVVVGKRDGSAHGGHLIEAFVRPTLEVYFSILPVTLERELDETTNLPLINLIQSEIGE